MSISAVCPHCRFSREVRDALKGRRAICPKCGKTFTIGQATAPAPDSPVTAKQRPEMTAPPPIRQPSPLPIATPGPTTASPSVETAQKIPNPLEPDGGVFGLCPTLQNQSEFDRFRALLLTPIQTPLEAKKMSAGYKLGLFLIALFMVLLPLVYVAMIAGFCALEYFYFVWTFDAFQAALKDSPGKGAVFMSLIYFSVPVGFGAIILILIKPLIFGWGGKDNRFEITREREPLLFEFVEHLCRFVGAPMPRRVFVNCDVNAYAGMSHGIWGAIFGGNACDLCIGLPLVAGMKTSELAGVLAHEFGHFTQAGTRRMDYIVRRVLWWFEHIYYYRDRMDAWIRGGAESGVGVIMLVSWVVGFFVWTARRFIWILMTLGNFAAGFMSRQMEFDADSFEVRLEGSARFAESTRRLLMLSIANQRTVSDINYMLQEERLPDNYPLLIAANMLILNERLQKIANKIIREGTTGLVDTHPCDRDRIEAARQMNVPGVMHIDMPASLIFRNFLALSREVSIHFYRNEAEVEIESGMLKNAGSVIDQLRREHLGQEALTGFFQRAYYTERFLPLQSLEPSKDARSMVFRLRQAQEKQAGFAVDALDAVKALEKADTRVVQGITFQELIRIGVRPDMSGAGFSFRNLSDATLTNHRLEAEWAAQTARLWNRDIAAAERLFAARELLGQEEIQDRIESGPALHRRMETLFPILQKIAERQNELDTARHRFSAAGDWIGRISSLPQQQAVALWKTLEEESDLMRRTTKSFQLLFSGTPYPFEHGKRETSLGNFLVPVWKEVEMGPGDFFQAFGNLLGRLFTTYNLMLGECAAMTLAVERSLGLTPLPVPPPEEDE